MHLSSPAISALLSVLRSWFFFLRYAFLPILQRRFPQLGDHWFRIIQGVMICVGWVVVGH